MIRNGTEDTRMHKKTFSSHGEHVRIAAATPPGQGMALVCEVMPSNHFIRVCTLSTTFHSSPWMISQASKE